VLCLSYYHLCFLFNKIVEDGRTSSSWKLGGCGEGRGQWGETAQTMYTHMNKCINNKKGKKTGLQLKIDEIQENLNIIKSDAVHLI
jgi:hypothetical protein